MSRTPNTRSLNRIAAAAATIIVGALASTSTAADEPIGACCHEYWGNGLVCEMLTDHVCGDYQGYWHGALVPCSNSNVHCDGSTNEPGACCLEDANGSPFCNTLSNSDCVSLGGYFYGVGTSCNDPLVLCEPVSVAAACCFDDPVNGFVCVEMIEEFCVDLGGYWYAGLSCFDPAVECEPISTGACCYDDPAYGFVCVEMIEEFCVDLGGYWYGAGSVCSDPFVECDPLMEDGACCYDDPAFGMVCVEVTQNACADLGGYFYGAGSVCSDPFVECEPLPGDGACCVEEEPGSGIWFCIETTLADCHSKAGVWYGIGSLCTDPGVNCDPIGCEGTPGSDCAGKPQYGDQDYQAFGGGRVAVQTVSPAITGGAMLTVFDLTGIGGAPFDTSLAISRYSHVSWTAANLGSILGLAIDEDGNIFVTASQTWNMDVAGPSGWGAVYRIDTNTAAITTFAVLPTAGSSLGSITYDCEHNQFFVSSFEDGQIYRLDSATGAVLDVFDHGTPWSGAPGPVALGDRPFAVEVNGDHLYYSLWNVDVNNPSATTANEIWSVELDPSGMPIAGTHMLIITIPPFYVDGNYVFSSPVADMDFTPSGTMILGERTQYGIQDMGAHQARVLEYECVPGGGWALSPHTFHVGSIPESAAGGVDGNDNRVWASADAMHIGGGDNIYGIQGLPAAGGSTLDSWLIDYNGNLNIQDKTLLGDLVVTRNDGPPPTVDCPYIQVINVDCIGVFAPFNFDMHFGISNMDPTGTIVGVVMTPPSGMTLTPGSASIALPPLHSWSIDSVLSGASQGSEVCIDFECTFDSGEVCTETVCVDLPMCVIWVPGDFDFDGYVNIDDLMSLIGVWGETCRGLDNDCDGRDLDESGYIDMGDLLIVLGNWTL